MSTKSVLGRGVGALLPDAPENLPEDKYFLCDINKIRANPSQPRVFFDEEKLQELAESIRENGVIQPLLVTRGPGGRYTLLRASGAGGPQNWCNSMKFRFFYSMSCNRIKALNWP